MIEQNLERAIRCRSMCAADRERWHRCISREQGAQLLEQKLAIALGLGRVEDSGYQAQDTFAVHMPQDRVSVDLANARDQFELHLIQRVDPMRAHDLINIAPLDDEQCRSRLAVA